jgi:hypothetical protein
VDYLYTPAQVLPTVLGRTQGALQIVHDWQKGAQHAPAFLFDLLVSPALLSLAKVVHFGLQAQSPISPGLPFFLALHSGHIRIPFRPVADLRLRLCFLGRQRFPGRRMGAGLVVNRARPW